MLPSFDTFEYVINKEILYPIIFFPILSVMKILIMSDNYPVLIFSIMNNATDPVV